MKWESKSTFSIYSFTIDVDAILVPVYHLVLEIVKRNYGERPFCEWAGDVFDIKAITGGDSLDKEMTDDLFVMVLSRHMKNYLYANMNQLRNTDIQLMYVTAGLLVAPSKTKMMSVVVSWIKNTGMMKAFLDLVKHESISYSKATLVKLMNDQYFGSAVDVKEIAPLKATLIPMESVNGCSIQPIDPDAIWLNGDLCQQIGVNLETQYGEVTFIDIEGISLRAGDWLIPLSSIDQHVKENAKQDYYWEMLKKVYASRKPNVSIFRDRCSDFNVAMKTHDFSQVMSKLQYNLYIMKDGQGIPEAYRGFFEEVYNIEEFIGKSKQRLFTGTHLEEQLQNKQTMLGIYQTEKTDTEYNLQAWINADTVERQTITRSGSVKPANIKTVYALKPHYSYYFCSDYFEDLFQEVLKEIGKETLHDVELSQSDNPNASYLEVDNFVRKSDGTIVLIETKTTLNRYNIEDTIHKVVKYHQIIVGSYPTIKMEYLIVAPYKHASVEDAYSFFTHTKGASATDFYLPIARFNGVMLHCVIEPEYEKLKAILTELLK